MKQDRNSDEELCDDITDYGVGEDGSDLDYEEEGLKCLYTSTETAKCTCFQKF